VGLWGCGVVGLRGCGVVGVWGWGCGVGVGVEGWGRWLRVGVGDWGGLVEGGKACIGSCMAERDGDDQLCMTDGSLVEAL